MVAHRQSVDITVIDSSCWSACGSSTGNGLSGCGCVVIDGKHNAGVNSSPGMLTTLISSRLKWRQQHRRARHQLVLLHQPVGIYLHWCGQQQRAQKQHLGT